MSRSVAESTDPFFFLLPKLCFSKQTCRFKQSSPKSSMDGSLKNKDSFKFPGHVLKEKDIFQLSKKKKRQMNSFGDQTQLNKI